MAGNRPEAGNIQERGSPVDMADKVLDLSAGAYPVTPSHGGRHAGAAIV